MKKIAIVVQRYGLEVNGGAEYHCRVLAERLNRFYAVTILTSCAKDYFSWANEYAEGSSKINDVEVMRFPSLQKRNKSKVHRLLKKLNKRTLLQQALRALGLLDRAEKLLGLKDDSEQLGSEWSREQGPYAPGLIAFLQEHQENYEALIFFTYLYYPTFMGLRVAPGKSILIPTAHDEPAIHLPVFRSFFSLPKAILYNTFSEKRMVNRLFNNEDVYSEVAGVGIEASIVAGTGTAADLLKSDIPYLLYIGRIDPGKGSGLLLECFLNYLKMGGRQLQLVLIGQLLTELPKHDDIRYLGFVTEEVKQVLLQGATALVMPSPHESLSMVTLEGMVNGIPVLVNGQSEVLRDHVELSGAGLLFEEPLSFASALDQIVDNEGLRKEMGLKGKSYVLENYNWDVILQKFKKTIEFVSG